MFLFSLHWLLGASRLRPPCVWLHLRELRTSTVRWRKRHQRCDRNGGFKKGMASQNAGKNQVLEIDVSFDQNLSLYFVLFLIPVFLVIFFLRSRIYNGELLISYIQHGHLNCTSYDMFLNILKWPNWTYGCSSWQVKLAAYKNEMSPFFLYALVPCMVLALQMLTVD